MPESSGYLYNERHNWPVFFLSSGLFWILVIIFILMMKLAVDKAEMLFTKSNCSFHGTLSFVYYVHVCGS